MKRIYGVLVITILMCTNFSSAVELSAREKVLVRMIMRQSLYMRLDGHRRFRKLKDLPVTHKKWIEFKKHPLWIAHTNTKDAEKKLLEIFNKTKSGEWRKLETAQALAYLGNNSGVAELRAAAFKRGYMTNSGFEIGEAALCLLYLEQDFPKSFKFSNTINVYQYHELDIFLEKK